MKLPHIWQKELGLFRHLRRDVVGADMIENKRAAHTSPCTVSIVTTQTSGHVALDESHRNQLASFTAANQWNFAYLEGKLWRKKLTC